MPGCVFHASGDDFLVDEFLTLTRLRPNQIWRRGEIRNHKGEVCLRSGFSIIVSEIEGELSDQCGDAIEFLRRNSTDLSRLASFPGVDDRRLDFGYDRRDEAVQSDYLPPELLVMAGSLSIGIELSLYPRDGSDV